MKRKFVKRAFSKRKRNDTCDKKMIELIMTKTLWTVNDLSIITGLARQTIYNKASKFEIPYRKRAGKLFFFRKEIMNWIDEGDE